MPRLNVKPDVNAPHYAIALTKIELVKFFKHWEENNRAGLCMGHDETSKMSVEQVAQLNTDAAWSFLTKGR